MRNLNGPELLIRTFNLVTVHIICMKGGGRFYISEEKNFWEAIANITVQKVCNKILNYVNPVRIKIKIDFN